MNPQKQKAYRELVEKVWELYDKNNDGVLQKTEVIRVFKDILDKDNVCKKSLDKLVEDVDLNGDGVVDKEELYNLFIKHRDEFA